MMSASIQANAASTISVPEEIVVLAINDSKVKSSLFKKKNEYQVEAGELNLLVRYQEYFENGIQQHDIIKSDVVQINIPHLEDAQRYTLKLLNAPKDHDDAKKFAQQPSIALINQSSQPVQQTSKVLIDQRLGLLQGLINNSNLSNTEEKASNFVSQTPTQAIKSNQVSNRSSEIKDESVSSNDQHLIQIWQKSTKNERQKFMTWLAEQ